MKSAALAVLMVGCLCAQSKVKPKIETVGPVTIKLDLNGVGPVVLQYRVHVAGKFTAILITGDNQSKNSIRYISFCVRPPSQEKCAAFVSSTSVWKPGPMDFGEVAIPASVKTRSLAPYVFSVIPDRTIYYVRKIFVGNLEGNASDMARDQLMALIINSNYFELVDSAEKADATLTGRYESRDAGEQYRSSGTSGAAIAAIGGGGIFGERAQASGEKRTIVGEGAILRLVSSSGESVWAWDDTKSCTSIRLKCAVEDLSVAARPAFN